jgi:hypothetical protein
MDGDTEAAVRVGHMLLAGYGVKQDKAEAARWLRHAWCAGRGRRPARAHAVPRGRLPPSPARARSTPPHPSTPAPCNAAATRAIQNYKQPVMMEMLDPEESAVPALNAQGGAGGGPQAAGPRARRRARGGDADAAAGAAAAGHGPAPWGADASGGAAPAAAATARGAGECSGSGTAIEPPAVQALYHSLGYAGPPAPSAAAAARAAAAAAAASDGDGSGSGGGAWLPGRGARLQRQDAPG